MAATFNAGGIVSGMDWNSIIDNLVELQKRPIATLERRQAAVQSQISSLGTLASRLAAFRDAAGALGKTGPLVMGASAAPGGVGVAVGDDAVAGRYGVRVERLAAPPKVRSAGFAPGETVAGGTLTLAVRGAEHRVTVEDGASLESVAWAVNHSGAPVTAVVLDDGTRRYLSITGVETGYPPGGTPAEALSVVEELGGAGGRALGIAVVQEAENALVHVDGLAFERSSNQVSGAIPGVTLTLKSTGAVVEDLVIERDMAATAARVRSFVDAYNGVIGFVQGQLNVSQFSDRERTLAGDSAVRSLQGSLQGLISRVAAENGSVRSLADLGIATGRDGSLTLDAAALEKAIERDARAVTELFTAADTGVAALARELVGRQIDTGGILAERRKSLERRVAQMGDEALRLEGRIETYREQLIQQFTAMENVVSGLKAMGNYLTAVSKQGSGKDS